MSQTRDRILGTALVLFNENGLANVSQRDITQKLGISPGNLTYHFKRKEDILAALYRQLVDRFSKMFGSMTDQRVSLIALMNFSEAIFELVWEYRFFFIDYVYLMNGNPEIAKHYAELMKQREGQFMITMVELKKEGLLNPEELQGQYEMLFRQLRITTDFFLSTQLPLTDPVELKRQFLLQVIHLVHPYLTELGKSELNALNLYRRLD